MAERTWEAAREVVFEGGCDASRGAAEGCLEADRKPRLEPGQDGGFEGESECAVAAERVLKGRGRVFLRQGN